MYSNAKILTVFAAILAAVSCLGAFIFAFVAMPGMTNNWSYHFAGYLFFLASSVGTIFLILSLRSTLSDLSVAEEANASQIKNLKKRIEELERKVNS